jgi:nucleotide-binding universal stress UspA family protein
MAFKKILVPLDGSQAAEASLPHAANLARSFDARLILLRVLDASQLPAGNPDSIDWRMQKAEVRRYLHGLAAGEQLKGLSVEVEIEEGRPADCILAVARTAGTDLIVMSAYGASGPSGFPFGGTAHKILSGATSSVAIVREPADVADLDATTYRRVLVPIDCSQRSEMALQLALAMAASSSGLEILVLHLVPEPMMPRREPLGLEEQQLRNQVIDCNRRAAEHHIADLKRQFHSSSPIEFKLEVTSHPVDAITRAARSEKVDLMVMTSPGPGQAQGLGREGLCQAIQAVSELPLVVLQANGQG